MRAFTRGVNFRHAFRRRSDDGSSDVAERFEHAGGRSAALDADLVRPARAFSLRLRNKWIGDVIGRIDPQETNGV